jgi:hypothetical protein
MDLTQLVMARDARLDDHDKRLEDLGGLSCVTVSRALA